MASNFGMMMEIPDSTRWLLTVAALIYVAGMYGVAYLAQRRVHDSEDYLLAGRRLPLSLGWMTLLATWFGAGTLLTVSDEVRRVGLQAATLDPLGAGLCLLFAACFIAGPMWRMGITTVSDFFRIKFGRTAELLSAVILVPSYFGWIAAQFTALAGILNLFWGIPLEIGLLMVAVLGTGYTLMGGMWSVTWTDAIQVTLLLCGLIVLAGTVLWQLAPGNVFGGLQRLQQSLPPEKWMLIPTHDLAAFWNWMDVLMIGALGNVAAQDLMQRVFACKSARTATWACGIAGVAYLGFGAVPILLALSSDLLLPENVTRAVLPALVQAFLNPLLAVIFLLALLSAILSTIDSAILSPASILSRNFVHLADQQRLLFWNRVAVVAVAACSLLFAYWGEDAYVLLEESYTITLVGLFVPLAFGLTIRSPRKSAGIASMLVGSAVWLLHRVLGWDHFLAPWLGSYQAPVALSSTVLAAFAFLLAGGLPKSIAE